MIHNPDLPAGSSSRSHGRPTRRRIVAVVGAAMEMGVFVAVRAVWQYFVALDRIQYHEGMEAISRWLDPLGHDQSQEIDQFRGLIEEQRRITGDAGLHED